MKVYNGNEIEYRILTEIAAALNEPVGAGMLSENLGAEIGISEATVGRYLRKLEQEGYLTSEKYNGRSRGRVITRKGEERIRELQVKKTQLQSMSEVIGLLKDGHREQLYNILITREIIEPEAAALAAGNASAENLNTMREILTEMDALESQGKSMAKTDAPFHIEVAKASGNPFLENILRMLRADRDYSPEIEAILQVPYQKTPSDHWRIYKAIKNHNPKEARQIMKNHIKRVIVCLESSVEKS